MLPRRHSLSCACLVLVAAIGWIWLGEKREAPRGAASDEGLSARKMTRQAAHGEPTAEPAPTRHAGHPAPGRDATNEVISMALADNFTSRILSPDRATVSIPVPDGGTVEGRVDRLEFDGVEPLMVEGRITHPEPGRFHFRRQKLPGKAGPLFGFIHFDHGEAAWQVRPAGGGSAELVRTTVHSVVCRAYPAQAAEIPATHPTDDPIPPAENNIIQLQSLPGAEAVVYLDFDGEERDFEIWGEIDAAPSGATNQQIFEVWQGVCEDFQPFNINITTIRSVYEAAAPNQRMQVIVTPTNTISPGAGGVAIIGSFNTEGDVVCWSFSSTGKNAIEVISHEVGHTLGLSHDGRFSPSYEEYYSGHFDWAPIMGVGYTRAVTQWSKGEYTGANNLQDDLLIISGNNNGVAYRADDHGSTSANAGWLDLNASGDAFAEGIIETGDDRDSFRFSTNGGNLSLQIQPVPPAGATAIANLDIKAELLRVTSSLTSIVASYDSAATTSAALNVASLTAGDYLIRVSGVGKGSLITGYSDYGSLGSYTIYGTVSGGVHAEHFFLTENSANGTILGNVPPRAGHSSGVLHYEISQDNSGGAFAIHPTTGQITVADSALLDFEALSSRWDDPATLNFTVAITDSLEYAMETIRVAVVLTDENEPPVFETPAPMSMPENVAIGTPVTRVRANDPDRADFAGYSIAGGNTGGVFAIDSGSGEITIAAAPDYQTTPVHNIIIRATDQAVPPNQTETTLVISLLPLPGNITSGSVVRTFYNGIPGSNVADLAGSQRFPDQPDSQTVLASFDTGTSAGYQYGSVVSGYLIAPATGNYTFWISAGESGQLLLSTDQNPANATPIAAAAGSSAPGQWNLEPGQQSAPIALQAGGVYYIEARQKQGFGTDHVQVAWQGPGMGAKEIIPGLWLAPYSPQFAPWAENVALTAREGASPGTVVGTLAFTEANLGQQIAGYVITAGNEDGYFTIDEPDGTIRVAPGAAFTAGETYQLTVTATDDGSPAAQGAAFANINILRLDEELHAWWQLDESAGTHAADSSGNGRTAWFTGVPGWIERDAADHALELDGSAAGFSRYDYDSPSGTTPFTVAAWVKIPASHSSEAVLVQQSDTSFTALPGYYRVSVTATGHVRFALYGDDAPLTNVGYQFDLVSSAAIHDGQWHHVACVRDGGTGRVFIDGVESASGSGTPRMLHAESDTSVGYDSKLMSAFLGGAIDDIRIYLDALNAQQLSRIANAPKLAITGPSAPQAVIPPDVGLWLDAVASAPVTPVTGIDWSFVSGPGAVVFESPSSASTGVTFGANGTYVLRVTATNGTDVISRDIGVSAGCTAVTPFAGTLVGQDGSGFHVNTSPGSYLLVGDSPGILPAATQDGFYLLGQVFAGDFDVITRVDAAFDNEFGDPYGIAGLAVRAGSAYAPDDAGGFIGLRPAASSATWIRRATTGAANIATDYPGINTPHWCRVTRAGDSVGFWDSPDGVTWTPRGSMTIAGNATVGMCWSSNATGFAGNAQFSGLAGLSTGNVGPAVDAGADFTAETTIATNFAGSASDDNLPAPPATVSTEWSIVSGPGTVEIADPADPFSPLTFGLSGEYILRLEAYDGAVRTFDDVTVTVTDPQPVVSVAATTPEAEETGPVNGVLTITRDVWPVGDLTVTFTLTGTADNIADYQEVASSVLIPDGVASVDIDIVPIADDLVEGPETVVLTITAGDYIISGLEAAVTIADSNHPPGWGAPLVVADDATQGAPYTGTLAADANDPDVGDLLTFTKEIGPAWLQVATDGTLSGTPANDDVGLNEFTVRVTDGEGLFAETTLQITVLNVNDAPFFSADPVVAGDATQDLAYSGTLAGTATDPDTADSLTFTKEIGPAWLQVATDGTLGGIPTNNDVGLDEFTVRVTDGEGLFAETTLQITVLNVNDAPFFSADPVVAGDATQDLPYSGTLAGTATDPDTADSLAFTKEFGPEWLQVATDGTLSGTPANSDLGINEFTVRVTDGEGLIDEATLQLTVKINEAPVFSTEPVVMGDATEDVVYSGTLAGSASDPDTGDTLAFTKEIGPTWLEVATDGTLAGTPANSDVGANEFTVRVTDAGGLFVEATLQINVINVNDAPEFSADPIIGVDATQDLPYSGTLAGTATDPDVGDSLVFTKEIGPAWLEVATDGTLSGTPANSDVGANEFTVRVTDAGGLFVEATLQINVFNVNDAPEFSADPIIGVDATEDVIYSGTLAGTAIDPDVGDSLVFTKESGPAWLEIATDGTLSGTPVENDIGLNQFTVRVTDGDGLFAEASLQIQVVFANEPPSFAAEIPAPPAAVAQIPYPGFDLADFADDPNLPQGDEIVFSKVSGPAWLDVATDGTLAGTPGIADIGPNSIVVRVTDLAGAFAETTLEIPVGPTILHLDVNGETAGSGVSGAVAWDSAAIWSAEADGVTTTHAWVPGATAVIAAGNDADAAVITLDGSQSLGGLNVEEGAPVLTGGALLLSETDAAFNIAAATTIESPVTGTNLGKTGTSTLTLAGPGHSLTGQLVVAGGTLELTGTIAVTSGVAVDADATLTGDGTITGAVAISGTLAPGADLGTLATGPLTMNDGSQLAWRIDSWTGVAGTDHDLVTAGSLELSGTVTIDVDAAAMADFADTAAEFTLVSTTGGITGHESTVFTIDTATLPQATGHWNVVSDGNDLKLTYTPLAPFELWQIAEFVEKSTDPQIAGETMDPDGDGLANLIEYTLGTDPELPGPTIITQDFVDFAGQPYIRLTVPRNPDATDITIVVETTSDLSDPGSWTALDTAIETDTPSLLVVRDTLGGPRRFIRLSVSR